MPERPLGTPCGKCGRTGHCRETDCCCNHVSHVSGKACRICGHGGSGEKSLDVYVATIDNAEALDAYLRVLNDGGVDPTVAGMDALQNPFLAMLRGAYADSDTVIFNTPWDSEVSYANSDSCHDCGAERAAIRSFTDLDYPVTVLVNSEVKLQ